MKQLIERREYKYLIPERRLDELRRTIEGFCKLDAHHITGGYKIRSLYFDTPDFRLHAANVREAPDRFKARLRSYPKTKAPVFFEIKHRIMDVIQKSRAPIPFDIWPSGLELGFRMTQQEHNVYLERFQTLYHTYHLQPKMLVDYRREAWMSEIDDYARVSIDRNIKCQPINKVSLTANPARWRPIDNNIRTNSAEPMCVIELKFYNRPPRWMVGLVNRLSLIRKQFSKYAYSVASTHINPTLRYAGYRSSQ